MNQITMNKTEENPTVQPAKKTYRFKFSEAFLIKLKGFSRIHRFDDAIAFKDNWEIWCDGNAMEIKNETESLKTKGYEGDCMTKMYKSVRYYFKNKSTKKKDVKKRCKYIGLDPDFRDAIDEHIVEITVRQELKPKDGYINFMDSTKYNDLIKLESLRLAAYDFNKKDILAKIKKTYKNRYFNIQNK
jgi:hypothetical protein